MTPFFSEVLFTTPLFIGSLLVIVAVSKFANPESFVTSVADYEILPITFVRPFASCLPFVEVLLGFSLLLGVRIQLASYIAACLFSIFAAAIAINLLRGRTNIACGCFGSKRRQIGWMLVVRNLSLTAIASIDAWRYVPLVGATTDRLSASLFVFGSIGIIGLLNAARTLWSEIPSGGQRQERGSAL